MLTLGPAQPSVQELEADHTPPPSTKIKEGGAILVLPHMYTWLSAKLIKCRDNFTFFHLVIK
jgi:hypothetical protein